MKRFFRSIIACICGLTIVFLSAVPPAFARDGVIGGVVDGVQSFTEWGVNNLNNFWKIIFGPDFNSASEEELKAAYDDYVTTLPAPGYDSSGGLLWSPGYSYIYFSEYSGSHYVCLHREPGFAEKHPGADLSFSCDCTGTGHVSLAVVGSSPTFQCSTFSYYFSGVTPVAGSYTLLAGPGIRGKYVDSSFKSVELSSDFSASGPKAYGSSVELISALSVELGRYTRVTSFSFDCALPVYKVVPNAPPSADTYNINTRPTSITGGNYGIVGDNGQITKVEDNSTIINETNNTFYNPATGQTVPITGWTYDYSDRSYKVTLESGDTATITYGDENITIQEGDTIYNVYYLVDGSGSENPPSACEHDWQESSSTDPTCTLPGKVTLSCSKCQQTKTESIPALGHDWQMKQTVTTQYDDTGQLTQQGYTIFECSRCHEQYKSTDGTAPPGGGSGTDPGGEEEGGGFLSWLFGKIGELLGTIGDGILNLLQTALEKIFGGLIDLVNSLFENLAKLVDLFDSVGEAFQVLWTWLPPEITAILVAGVSIFVFVALLKFFTK